MGITNFMRFLKDKFPKYRFFFPLTYLKGKKVAVDIAIVNHVFMSIAQKRTMEGKESVIYEEIKASEARKASGKKEAEKKKLDEEDDTAGDLADTQSEEEKKSERDHGLPQGTRSDTVNYWLHLVLSFLCTLIEGGITPVVVFDGKAPKEKIVAWEKRQKTRDYTNKAIEACKKKLENEDDLVQDTETREKLVNLIVRSVLVTDADKKLLKRVLAGFGFPVLTAAGEAEELCAALVREGMCYASYTRDSDILAYGCPRTVFGIKKGMLEIVTFSRLLKLLGIESPEQFRDFAIMCGTDFNHNVKGYSCVKCHALIKKWKKIEDIKDSRYDAEDLDYEMMREIFKWRSTEVILKEANDEAKKEAKKSQKGQKEEKDQKGGPSLLQDTKPKLEMNPDAYSHEMEDYMRKRGVRAPIPRIKRIYGIKVDSSDDVIDSLNVDIISMLETVDFDEEGQPKLSKGKPKDTEKASGTSKTQKEEDSPPEQNVEDLL